MEYIRNFSIIAHINHGKSTLSDRFIQICGGLNPREMVSQVLDSMELERERGITIKSQSVTLNYTDRDRKLYQLNLIDTPGHVDFSYEVSRSLSVCEGALLVIDASQGIEAQTIAHYRVAVEMKLHVIVVVNKIDLSIVNLPRINAEITDIIGVDSENIMLCSAKTGFGITKILERIISDVPAPSGDCNAPLQALIIDSWFNNYFGVVLLVRIKNGKLRKGDVLFSMNTGKKFIADKVGIFTPKEVQRSILNCGEVGWLVSSTKDMTISVVGDTLTLLKYPAITVLPSFKKIKPYMYAGLFPLKIMNEKIFSNALYKLSLNDASLQYKSEKSELLGMGFRCGFLGPLHMEIIRERLKREYFIDLIVTAPTVEYEIHTIDNKVLLIDNPSQFLSINNIKEVFEPIVLCNILFPKQYVGKVIGLCVERRGIQVSIMYKVDQVILTYELPMSEIILNFFDNIKSVSNGYASFEYKFSGFRKSNIVCVEILINNRRIDALSIITHLNSAESQGRMLVNKLQALIPRHQFDIFIQASIKNKILCRSTIKQFRKNVISKCYGGDITRKKKLLFKQKLGKKRMKIIGSVNLPDAVFLSMLNRNN